MRIALGENAKMALDTLRENKLRSFLTVLGVVIGITALITVSSILVGFYADITVYLNDYGANTVWVFKVSPGINTGRMTAEERNRKPLTNRRCASDPGAMPGGAGSVRVGHSAHL